MRWQRASAKVNLTLRVVGRRADGYHDLESLVAFAGLCDWLAFEPGDDLIVEVLGSRASEAGPVDENIVARAARSLAAHLPGLRLGRFRLVKHLPAAAGLGGGSADAAAALRLLAEEAGLSVDDPRIHASALATGADVLVCLSPQARIMRGIGDKLGAAVRLPKVFALLVNPQVRAPTREVFAALGLAPGSQLEVPARSASPLESDAGVSWDVLSRGSNDLVAAAIRVAPAIATVLKRLSQIPEAQATGMSGSGATCFALFGDRRGAAAARRIVAAEHPGWWVEATGLY
jgi:4-diphosphocytidyl-2-C-methyl-D-erythritol kinase